MHRSRGGQTHKLPDVLGCACFVCRFWWSSSGRPRWTPSGLATAIFCEEGCRCSRLQSAGCVPQTPHSLWVPSPGVPFHVTDQRLATRMLTREGEQGWPGEVHRGEREHHRTLAFPALHTHQQPIRVTRPAQPIASSTSLASCTHPHPTMFFMFTPSVDHGGCTEIKHAGFLCIVVHDAHAHGGCQPRA